MKKHPLLTKEIIATFCITLLALTAMLKGIDTYVFTIAIIAIAGIAGYQLKATLPEGLLKYLTGKRKK